MGGSSGISHRARVPGMLWITRILSALIFSTVITFAQEKPLPAADLTAKSLPFRTALFHDPTLAPPLERLLQLYREAGRAKELVDLYRQHVAQYPADIGALTILVRLLAATDDPEAGGFARKAAERVPENAFLQFLLFEHLQKAREAGALDALDRAIAKETMPARKRAWIEQLLPLATAEGRPELAQKHLETLAAQSRTAEEKVEVARKMIAQKLEAAALAVLDSAAALAPAAETGVEIDLAAASAEIGLKKADAAAARLDRVLARLAADYWRRAEILHRRTALVKSDAERDAMLGAARARWKAAPGDESAALEVSQLLAAFEFRREALDILLDAARRIPSSEKIEKTALELFDRLRDERGRETFLADRLRASPDRQDLALARTRSLFLLNRRSEALAVFDALAAKLDPAARLTQLLELARFLRRNTLSADAAAIFERAVALAPARLDVRRELAETWLVLGEKPKARAVFSGPLPADTETENLLDVIQFLLKQELFAEAQAALAAKVAREPQNFDLRLMQLTVAARLADQAGGTKLVEQTRALADTDARYRRWLEAAVAFHQVFETDTAFLAEQQERAAAEPDAWTRAKLDRTLAFVEVATGHGRKADIAAMLEAALAGKVAPDVRVELRRRQFALIENDPAQTAAVEKQLQALIADDPARADEYRIRLAMLYSRLKRSDQAARILSGGEGREMLAAIDVKKVNDAALLGGLENILREFGGGGPRQVEILERLTAIEPANRGAWERWLTALAGTGDEDRLRSSLRRLLAGIEKLTLTDDTRALLEDHLLASHWRSLHLLLREAEKDDAHLSEALPMLDAAERVARERDEWLWIAWTRAYSLNRLGRGEARDAAIRELDRVAALAPAKPQSKKEGDEEAADDKAETSAEGIAFPDGLVIGMKEARALLTAPPVKAAAAPAASAIGPRGALHARWAFDTDQQAPITKVLPLDAARMLVLDGTGRLYCVDAATGKLGWARDGARPALPQRDENGNFGGGIEVSSLAVPVVDGARIFLPAGDQIECWSADDGRRMWRAPALRSMANATPVHPSLFIHAGRLLVCDPSAASVAALDPASGKLLWQRDYPRSASMTPLHALNTGASLSDGKLLCYGNGAVIVNADDGALLWSFDTSRVKEFPIALNDASAPAAPPAAQPVQMGYSRGRYYGRSSYASYGSYGRGYSGQSIQFDYLQRAQIDGNVFGSMQPGTRLMLTNSAAAWAGGNTDGGQLRFGMLAGARLVLFNNQVMRTVRLDLPFSGGGAGVNGTFIALAGRRACLLNGSSLALIDLDSSAVENVTLDVAVPPNTSVIGVPSVAGANEPVAASVQAAVDGLTILVSGPRGIARYNTRNGARIESSPWPAGIVPAAQPMAANDSVNWLPQGRFRNSNTGRGGGLETIAAVVSGGVFYTPVSGSRLVALAGEEKERAK